MIDLSVIVPIYNVENYLRECLDSLIHQSFKNIQIICINDGSTDGSLSIILEYARRDLRIEVVDKVNSGYGNSCNIGIDKALGKYIAILEPDDFIELSMYEKLMKIAQENDSDISKCAYYEYFDSTEHKDSYKVLPKWTQNIKPLKEVFEIREFPSLLFYHPSIWAGVYKREFLLKNNIRFVEAKGAAWVDNPFFIQTMCLAKRISYTNWPYYFYRQSNPNSSSNKMDFSIPLERIRDMNDFFAHHQEIPSLVLIAVLKKYIRYLLLSIYSAKNQKVSQHRIKSHIYVLIDGIIRDFKMPKMLKIRFLLLRFMPLGMIYGLYSVLRWIKYRFLK